MPPVYSESEASPKGRTVTGGSQSQSFDLNKKVLVIRRSPVEYYLTGYYELPGGKVDFGDDPKQSLEREFVEEVNLKVKALYPYRVFTYLSDKGNRHTIELVYLVQLDDNLKLSKEHDDFKWISLNDICSLKMSCEIKLNIKVGLQEIKKKGIIL
ncbi:MAG: NUDIX hydrolase [Patescibacteria group bacterium]